MDDFKKAAEAAASPMPEDEKFAENQCSMWADWASLDEEDKEDTLDGYLRLYSAGFKRGAEWAKLRLENSSNTNKTPHEIINDIVQYIRKIHSENADGCKGSCSEQEVGFRASVYGESSWYCNFGGYCIGDLSRQTTVKSNTLEGLFTEVKKVIEDALERQKKELELETQG